MCAGGQKGSEKKSSARGNKIMCMCCLLSRRRYLLGVYVCVMSPCALFVWGRLVDMLSFYLFKNHGFFVRVCVCLLLLF